MISLWRKMKSVFRDDSDDAIAKRVYLDYASATPMNPEVLKAMMPYFAEDFGNAGAIHQEGARAKLALHDARAQVAQILGTKSEGVVFTSGGTESNNLAIVGVIEKLVADGYSYNKLEIISTKLEHPATLKTLEALAKKGVNIVYAPVTIEGHIDMTILPSLLSEKTVLMTLAYINSEVGTITRCREVRRVLDRYSKKTDSLRRILFHVDAAQAPLWLPCELSRLGVDLLSLDAGKFCGPKGCGVLAFLKDVELSPIIYGGGQERGLRPGTEPLPLVVGTAKALSLAQAGFKDRSARVAPLRDYFFAELTKHIPQAIINGPTSDARTPNNVHISIPGLDAEYAVVVLDTAGISASTKSACSSKGGGASTVVLTMTDDLVRAFSTLRFTFGPEITLSDIDQAISVLTKHVAQNLNIVNS
ncbi:MAG: cysteine desulfurase family protein [Candidatus Paceibacteria bacterium]